jgi:hypothetical protein
MVSKVHIRRTARSRSEGRIEVWEALSARVRVGVGGRVQVILSKKKRSLFFGIFIYKYTFF